MSRRTTALAVTAALLLLAPGVPGAREQQAPPASPQKQAPPPTGTPKDFALPKPSRFTLPNGMAVTMVPFGQVPKVTLRLVVAAGNLYEGKDEVWLADLTGRMLREGTAARPAAEVAREFAGMGGELSVGVGSDNASLSAEVLAERGADAARLIAEVARQPLLPAGELARVKAGLTRDLAIQRSTPQAQAQERFHESIYGDHPYGRLFPTEEMLNGYTIERVRTFHRARYTPAASRLYVAGVFDAAALEGAIRDAFGAWKGSAGASEVQPPTAKAERRFALLDRPGAPQSTLYLGLRVPDPSSADWVALQVTNSLLGGSFGSRITTNIREQKGYTYSPFSAVNPHRRDAYWAEVADVTSADTGAALKEIFSEIERLRRDPPPEGELRGIKNNMAGSFVVRNSSRQGVISQLAFVDEHGLGDGYLAGYVKRVMAVTPQEVTRVAREYLVPDRMTLVVVGDRKTVEGQLAPWSAAGQ
ncbi:MAG TPA: pitrilysin family protein [Vicinamibacterales bacterium]|nr:pitrilysin family protein [Vicinamibacterales bacterium]